eukprot:TRINITY_DN6211_c0_g1_i1.p1 TRINITY_DN6211_c0_g1~~TRINITY_DN6211_c0_g1_i1.p1  ORF type:complete len:192 (-),score=55.44 TRINITY_DN6211_c0_g1_i1:70-645(-)
MFGFPDHSLRYYSSVGNKLLSLVELVHDGPITTSACSQDGKIIITGGVDGVLKVITEEKAASFGLSGNNNTSQTDFNDVVLPTLCGHKRPISCISISRDFSIFISASLDKSIIVWDLNSFSFLRQLVLKNHSSHKFKKSENLVKCIEIDSMNGDIFIATEHFVDVFSLNGNYIGSLTFDKKHSKISSIIRQ